MNYHDKCLFWIKIQLYIVRYVQILNNYSNSCIDKSLVFIYSYFDICFNVFEHRIMLKCNNMCYCALYYKGALVYFSINPSLLLYFLFCFVLFCFSSKSCDLYIIRYIALYIFLPVSITHQEMWIFLSFSIPLDIRNTVEFSIIINVIMIVQCIYFFIPQNLLYRHTHKEKFNKENITCDILIMRSSIITLEKIFK